MQTDPVPEHDKSQCHSSIFRHGLLPNANPIVQMHVTNQSDACTALSHQPYIRVNYMQTTRTMPLGSVGAPPGLPRQACPNLDPANHSIASTQSPHLMPHQDSSSIHECLLQDQIAGRVSRTCAQPLTATSRGSVRPQHKLSRVSSSPSSLCPLMPLCKKDALLYVVEGAVNGARGSISQFQSRSFWPWRAPCLTVWPDYAKLRSLRRSNRLDSQLKHISQLRDSMDESNPISRTSDDQVDGLAVWG